MKTREEESMDVRYYYYVTRYLTEMLGFSTDESQTIAGVCQFIEDSRTVDNRCEYDEVPEELIDRRIAVSGKKTGKMCIPIPKTNWEIGMDGLPKKEDCLNENNQWNCFVPFHYYPQNPVRVDNENDKQYYTHAIKNIMDNPEFEKLVNQAK